MSQPFSGMPNPEIPRPFKRRSQPAVVQEAVLKAVRAARDGVRPLLHSAQRRGQDAMRLAQRHGQNLWQRGRRNPRTVGLIGGAVGLTLVGAIALNASSAGRSLCPSAGKTAPFLLLMDPLPSPAVRSELEIHYDVCGLPSGSAYRAKVRLTQQRTEGKTGKKKKPAQPKPLVITFQDKVDGPATRRHRPLYLGSMKPGRYTIELSVVDGRGRERKRLQKVLVKAQ